MTQHFCCNEYTTEFAINATFFSLANAPAHSIHEEIHALNASSNIRDGTRVDIFNSNCDVNVRINGNIRIL